MTSTILVPTDLTARSDRAIERAKRLAKQRKALLRVLHVVDQELPPSVLEAQSSVARRTILDQIKPLKAGRDVDVQVVAGRDHVEILRHAQDCAADLIVLGSHRQEFLKDYFRPSTAERVVRGCRVPVLLVTRPAARPYRHAVVGMDFSEHSRHAARTAMRLLPDIRFHLVHAYEVPFAGFQYGAESRDEAKADHERRMDALVEEEVAAMFGEARPEQRPFDHVSRRGEVAQVLCQELKQHDADLLVLGTHGKTGLAQAVLGSVAQILLRQPPCDVLVVPPADRPPAKE